MRTSACMYSHTRSFSVGVLAIALIAFSISPIIPNVGVGRCPERMIEAVVIDGSGPIIGEEERPASIPRDQSKIQYIQNEEDQRTRRGHMPLHLLDEIPYFLTAIRVLEAERVINTVRFGPNNERICHATDSAQRIEG